MTGLFAISLTQKDFVVVEKKLTITMRYPVKAIQFIGKPALSTDLGVGIVTVEPEQGLMTVEISPVAGQPLIIPGKNDPLIQLPFKILNDIDPDQPLRFQITQANTTNTQGEIHNIKYLPVEVALFYSVKPTVEKKVMTSESAPATVQKTVVTQEQPVSATPKPAVVTKPVTEVVSSTQPIQKGTPAIIIADKTKLSPGYLVEKTKETVFAYVGVQDKEGTDDVSLVEMNLSSLGLSARQTLSKISTEQGVALFRTSFILPDALKARSETYLLPITVVDRQGHISSGSISFVLHAEETQPAAVTTVPSLPVNSNIQNTVTPPSTPTSPSTTALKLDLNGDGVVDTKDVSLYLDAYQSYTNTHK